MNHGGHSHHHQHLQHPASFGGFTANMGSGASQRTAAKRNNITVYPGVLHTVALQCIPVCYSAIWFRANSAVQWGNTPVDIARGERGGTRFAGNFSDVQKCQTFHETLQQESDF